MGDLLGISNNVLHWGRRWGHGGDLGAVLVAHPHDVDEVADQVLRRNDNRA